MPPDKVFFIMRSMAMAGKREWQTVLDALDRGTHNTVFDADGLNISQGIVLDDGMAATFLC